MLIQNTEQLEALRAEIERLREQLLSATYCLYFLLIQTPKGRIRISAQDIVRIPVGHTVVRREVFETGDIEFKLYDATQDGGFQP